MAHKGSSFLKLPVTMFIFFPRFFFAWVILPNLLLSFSSYASDSWCPNQYVQQSKQIFRQKTNVFWEFKEQSNSWVELELPYDLVSCVDGDCTKVSSIDVMAKKKKKKIDEAHAEKEVNSLLLEQTEEENPKKKKGYSNKNSHMMMILPLRKRVSLIKMSEASIWVTGESGSIYERFWNGFQWVIAPHDLPVSAGYAISVLVVNQTILALSEAGCLYQMQLSENSQPVWIEFTPILKHSGSKGKEEDSVFQLKSSVMAQDRQRIYFCTKNGSLLELSRVEPPRWINHGRPPGANVAAIADVDTIRLEVVFTVSSAGDLYEYDRSSKPPWKKHIWKEGSTKDDSLTPTIGCSLHGLSGPHSMSLFLLTKGGKLVERRLHHRKWKWIVHKVPEGHQLSSITPVLQEESDEKLHSLFFATTGGLVLEYRMQKQSGIAQENQNLENWVNHIHPQHAKAARGITGLQFQVGRIIFPLDDGRLGELHLPGHGGENIGPTHLVNIRRKGSLKFVWSILDAPETEGWNAEYCTEEHGPSNCIMGIKDEVSDADRTRSVKWRKGSKAQQYYLSPANITKSVEEHNIPDNWINSNFHLRVIGRSFFLVTKGGITFEYLNTENLWFWMRHEHSTAMKGVLGSYNGSLFLVDEYGSLLIRERSSNELVWINCTAMRKGRQVIGGPPWDAVPGKVLIARAEDALFFVSKTGRLLQFSVAQRKFKWKDCRNPPDTKIACVVDQEVFRENIVFVVGRNGRLYQYNKVTELWHEHSQSQHLVLARLPGAAMRPSSLSLTGSLFMISENGGLVEYHWNSLDGWNWVEHGIPSKSVTLVGSPGPCVGGVQLFLIGSDGKVYLRHSDQTTWKWKDCGFPCMENAVGEDEKQATVKTGKDEVCVDQDFTASLEKTEDKLHPTNHNCDPKIASTRPVLYAADSVIFELRDGRLAEIRRVDELHWIWSRIIGTPTSSCMVDYWTALPS